MARTGKLLQRGDPRLRVKRELARRRDRESGPQSFARALALIGSVGWPVVVLTTGGALFGRYLDRRFQTGPRWALALLVVGLSLGVLAAYRALKGDGR